MALICTQVHGHRPLITNNERKQLIAVQQDAVLKVN
jgi:hypothetical protein